MTDRIVSYRSEISLNRNICDSGTVLFQLRATSRVVHRQHKQCNSERCSALSLPSEGTPLHGLSSPPIDLNCAPVRQWKAWEWEDQLGSDPSGFVTSGKPFWNPSLLCSSKPPKGYLQTFAYRFIHIFFFCTISNEKGNCARNRIILRLSCRASRSRRKFAHFPWQ